MRCLSLILALIIQPLQAQETEPNAPKKTAGLSEILDGESGIPQSRTYELITGVNTSTNLSTDDAENLTIVMDGKIELRGDNGLQIFANRAVANEASGKVFLSGNVTIYQNGLVYRGDSTTYDIKKKRADTSKLRVGVDPFLMEAGNLQSVPYQGGNIFVGENMGITTHDTQDPDFWLRARKTTIIPGERVIFQDLKVVAGDKTVFWLPYLSQPFDQKLGYHFVPGGRSNLGFFLKNRYGVMLGGTEDPVTGIKTDSWLLSQFQADLYTLRGIGLGADLFDTRVDNKDDFGWLKLYYIHDFNSELERAGIDRGTVTSNRFRIDLDHRIDILKGQSSTYSFEANLTKLSDPFFLEDFDRKMARIDSAPDNFLALTRRNGRSITSLGARLQVNSFYQSDTRLPEITHDWVRQPLFESSVLYESQSSLGFYDEHLSDFNEDSLKNEAATSLPGDPRLAEINRLLDDRGYTRFHTYHEFSSPFKIGHLSITPRIGAGYTSYSSVQGSADSTTRTHLSAGFDASFKMTRSYPEWVDQKWGLDGALHIIEPYASFSWLSTDELDDSFQRIERLSPTTRPRTRRIGRFSASDELEDWQTLRLGARNRIVNNRDGVTHDWLSVDTYFDAFFEDPEFDRDFSNLYNDIIWRPLPWLELDLETQFPLFNDSNFTEIASSLTFMPEENFEIRLGYRRLSAHPILRDSNRIQLETFARLNDYWGIGTEHNFEIEDQTLELQRYNLHYDFDSWVGSVGLFHRDNPNRDELGILFSFGLKEIPKLSLPISFDSE